jgi:hypothetical protein
MSQRTIIVTEKYPPTYGIDAIIIDQGGKMWRFNDLDLWAQMRIGKTYKVITGEYTIKTFEEI